MNEIERWQQKSVSELLVWWQFLDYSPFPPFIIEFHIILVTSDFYVNSILRNMYMYYFCKNITAQWVHNVLSDPSSCSAPMFLE